MQVMAMATVVLIAFLASFGNAATLWEQYQSSTIFALDANDRALTTAKIISGKNSKLSKLSPKKPRRYVIVGKNAFILHADSELTFFGKRVYFDDPDLDESGDLDEWVTDLSGIVPNPLETWRSTGLRNGFAMIKDG